MSGLCKSVSFFPSRRPRGFFCRPRGFVPCRRLRLLSGGAATVLLRDRKNTKAELKKNRNSSQGSAGLRARRRARPHQRYLSGASIIVHNVVPESFRRSQRSRSPRVLVKANRFQSICGAAIGRATVARENETLHSVAEHRARGKRVKRHLWARAGVAPSRAPPNRRATTQAKPPSRSPCPSASPTSAKQHVQFSTPSPS